MARPGLDALLARAEGYNKVTAHSEPGGGVILMLHHRNTLDDALLVYVASDDCVAELSSDVAQRTNVGGPWKKPRGG